MKLLPTPPFARRTIRGDDAVGQGMDAAFTLALFLGLGFLLDRWLGTTPLFMIVFFLLVSVALFVGWKARYTERMDILEERRRNPTGHRQSAPGPGTVEP